MHSPGGTQPIRLIGTFIDHVDRSIASTRLDQLMAANNGKRLRDDVSHRQTRLDLLCATCSLLRKAPRVDSLAEARRLHQEGRLSCVEAALSAVTTGSTPASVNMFLDRDAKAFGVTDRTLRAFIMGDTAIIYVGKPK